MALSLDGTTGISASGNIVGNNISVGGSLTVGSFNPSSLVVSGNVTGGNILTGGLISATGTITGSTFSGAGTNLTGTAASLTVGTATVAGTVTTATQPNITSVGTLTSLNSGAISSSGNVTGGNILTGGSVSAAGNITGLNINSSNADLAEMYVSDNDYLPGTVVEFGGQYEITATTQSHSARVAGIISTAPGYLMNSTQMGNHVLPVALTGRVPCLVMGPVTKGDRLVSGTIKGTAQVLDLNQYTPACIIGKALQDHTSDQIGIIEVAVGRT
jgi:hypothetical protein